MHVQPLRVFVRNFTLLVDGGPDEAEILEAGGNLLATLIADSNWLPPDCANPHPRYYQQFLLHCDPLERFSVVSFVWGPGQRTPVHDHMVWGMVGVLRGAELCRRYSRLTATGPLNAGEQQRLDVGCVDMLSPAAGDIHEVANAYDDRVSISIHVYGGNIGAVQRHVFDPTTSMVTPFVSGYSNSLLPNFWDRSVEVRAAIVQV